MPVGDASPVPEESDERVRRTDLVRLAEEHPGGVVNTAMAEHISNVGAAVAARGAPPADNGELARLINRTPLSMRDFIRANRKIPEAAR